MLRRRAAPLRFWQKIYLTTLALFLVCLFGGVWGAATVSCRLSFSARCDEFLARQRAFVQRAAEDIPVLTASRPAALDALYSITASRPAPTACAPASGWTASSC